MNVTALAGCFLLNNARNWVPLVLSIQLVATSIAADPILSPITATVQHKVLPYDSSKALAYAAKWCKTGNDCNDGQFKEPDGTDCTHFVCHALAAAGVKVDNVDPLCKSGLCIRVKQLAPAFFNATKKYSNVKQVAKEDARPGDFVFRISLFGSKSHVMILAAKPDAKGAKVYGHDNNRCAEYVEFDLDDCKYYRIEDAVDVDIDKLMKQLTRHEGKRSVVYKDSEGIPTIGIGFNLNRSDAKAMISAMDADYDKILAGTEKLSDEQIAKLFDSDIQASIAGARTVVSNFSELSEVRKRVLTDMTFNLGVPGLKNFKKMCAAIESQDYASAAVEMKSSKWCKQVKTRGDTLVEMMKSNSDPEWLK
jgi:GH24 family phage-related lysozyme (muramidase)